MLNAHLSGAYLQEAGYAWKRDISIRKKKITTPDGPGKLLLLCFRGGSKEISDGVQQTCASSTTGKKCLETHPVRDGRPWLSCVPVSSGCHVVIIKEMVNNGEVQVSVPSNGSAAPFYQ